MIMLRKTLFAFFFFLSVNARGQCLEYKNIDTSIFYSKLSKTIDTVHFTAIFKSLGKNPHLSIVNSLIKQKKIAANDYSTSLELILTGVNKIVYLPFKNIDSTLFKALAKNQNSGKQVCIDAIIFKEYRKINSSIFFVIDKINFK